MTSPRYACLHCNASVAPGVCTCEKCLKEGHITLKGGACPVCDKNKGNRQLQDSVTAVLKDMLLLSVMVLFIPLSFLACAPAPRAKNKPLFDPAGEWRLTWCGSTGPAVFRRDGTLSYFWGPDKPQYRWDGLWEMKGKTIHTWSWSSENIPEPGTEKSDGFHWPLDVEKFLPRMAEGATRSGKWRMER